MSRIRIEELLPPTALREVFRVVDRRDPRVIAGILDSHMAYINERSGQSNHPIFLAHAILRAVRMSDPPRRAIDLHLQPWRRTPSLIIDTPELQQRKARVFSKVDDIRRKYHRQLDLLDELDQSVLAEQSPGALREIADQVR